MIHTAGVDVALLRSEAQVGRDAKAEILVGVVLGLTDVTLVHRQPVPGPGDLNCRRMEFVDKADEDVGDSRLHLLPWVDQGRRTNCDV